MSSNSVLASLTATYTDSEGEEGADDHDPRAGTVVILTEDSSNLSKASSPAETNKRVKKLVSYHDDTYVSSDEEDQEVNKALSRLKSAAGEGIQLPDEPKGKCSKTLQEKINKFHERMTSHGLDMNRIIQNRKDFRNPSIYDKLIQYCKIDELGTNYPAEHYDPSRWGKESFYEELAKAQKKEMDKREKDRKDKARVEIMTGTAKKAAAIMMVSEEAKRKSKWDQTAVAQQKMALTTNITGTKTTVISAFGILPKRPRI